RLVAGVYAEQVVEDENLSVRCGAGADPDHGDLELRHQGLGYRGRDRLEDDREAANGLEGQSLLGESGGRLRGPALRLEAAQGGCGLGGQTDVPHHRNPGADDRAGPVDGRATALELDGIAGGLLDEALGVLDRLLVRHLV